MKPMKMAIGLFGLAVLAAGLVIFTQKRSNRGLGLVDGKTYGPKAFAKMEGPPLPKGLFYANHHAFGSETGFYAVGGLYLKELTPSFKKFCEGLMAKGVDFNGFIKGIEDEYPEAIGAYRYIYVPMNGDRTFRVDYKSKLQDIHQQFFVRRTVAESMPEVWNAQIGSFPLCLQTVCGYMAWVISPKHSYGMIAGDDPKDKTAFLEFIAEVKQSDLEKQSDWKAFKVEFGPEKFYEKGVDLEKYEQSYLVASTLLDSPNRGISMGAFLLTKSLEGPVRKDGDTLRMSVDGHEYIIPEEKSSDASLELSNFPRLIEGKKNGQNYSLVLAQPPVYTSDQVLIGKQD